MGFFNANRKHTAHHWLTKYRKKRRGRRRYRSYRVRRAKMFRKKVKKVVNSMGKWGHIDVTGLISLQTGWNDYVAGTRNNYATPVVLDQQLSDETSWWYPRPLPGDNIYNREGNIVIHAPLTLRMKFYLNPIAYDTALLTNINYSAVLIRIMVVDIIHDAQTVFSPIQILDWTSLASGASNMDPHVILKKSGDELAANTSYKWRLLVDKMVKLYPRCYDPVDGNTVADFQAWNIQRIPGVKLVSLKLPRHYTRYSVDSYPINRRVMFIISNQPANWVRYDLPKDIRYYFKSM